MRKSSVKTKTHRKLVTGVPLKIRPDQPSVGLLQSNRKFLILFDFKCWIRNPNGVRFHSLH